MFWYVRAILVIVVLNNVLGNHNDDGNFIPELKYLNRSVDPCENFYEFACGNFEKVHPLPPDKIMLDQFSMLQEELENIITAILSSDKESDDLSSVKKAKDMQFACMNEDFNNFLHVKPMADAIMDLGGWPIIHEKYADHYGHFSWAKIGDLVAKYGINHLLSMEILPFWLNATVPMIMLGRDPLTLPSTIVQDPDELTDGYIPLYETRSENEPSPYEQYLETIAVTVRDYMGTWTNIDFIRNGIENFMRFTMKIKQAANVPNINVQEVNPPTTVEQLQQWSDNFGINFTTRIDWLDFFQHAFKQSGAKVYNETNVYMSDMNAVANVLTLIEETPPVDVFNFVVTRLMTYMAPDTNMQMWEEFNKFCILQNYTVYSRSQFCGRKITSHPYIGLSLAVAHVYQQRYFNINKIKVAEIMTDDLKAAFLELLAENKWMDDNSKKAAKYKLLKMLMLIGYPDMVSNATLLDEYYGSLRVCRYDHAGNVLRLRVFNMAKNFALIDKPRDRTLWSQSPLYANAFYNQLNNRILIPAGIMNSPFYTGNTSVVDYARIGSIIGHEITHGFDNKGKNTDAEGTIASHTWTNETLQAFNEKADCILQQYSKFHIDEIDINVNGLNTLGENIADNGGLREAYYAFQKIIKRQKVVADTDFTWDQLFFISYATMWCRIDTPMSLEIMSKKDVHSPNRFRVIGTVSNMAEFSEAFHCPVGSGMNPIDKCILW